MLLLVLPIGIWSVTGSYFVLMDLGFIRGDHIKVQDIKHIDPSQIHYPMAAVYERFPKAQAIALTSVTDTLYYRIKLSDKSILVNADSGELLPSITEKQARIIASNYQHHGSLAVEAKLVSATLLTDIAPAELAPRYLPVWRVDFNDSTATSLYLSATTGELVTRRHDYWRLFDLFWKWHIMDYDEGEAIDNLLLLSTALISIVAVLAGFILLWQRRRRYLR